LITSEEVSLECSLFLFFAQSVRGKVGPPFGALTVGSRVDSRSSSYTKSVACRVTTK
jgi:hypothetical protein